MRRRFHRVWHGDALEVMRALPSASVACCVTSPPYFGLRDYGTGRWVGGDFACNHRRSNARHDHSLGRRLESRGEQGRAKSSATPFRESCRCGAVREDRQVGLEPTLDAYVARLVEVFRELRRVLRDDGTFWLVVGDSFSHGGNGSRDPARWPKQSRNDHQAVHAKKTDLPPKSLLGVPWKLAFALQDDGWILRSDVVWAKTAPMPESVRDRPTRAHEFVFLFSKNGRYFYDADLLEPFADDRKGASGAKGSRTYEVGMGKRDKTAAESVARGTSTLASGPRRPGKNLRSVWEYGPKPYRLAHFATFPPPLAERMVRLGSRPGDVVLDPFSGAATVGLAASRLGRRFWGIDLNAEYVKMGLERIAEGRR